MNENNTEETFILGKIVYECFNCKVVVNKNDDICHSCGQQFKKKNGIVLILLGE